MNRALYAIGGVGLTALLALCFWWFGDDESKAPAAPTAVASASADPAVPARPDASARPDAAQAVPAPADAAADGAETAITLNAPPRIWIGTPYEMVVNLGENTGISEISFTVQLDAAVLQARSAVKGDWGSGPGLSERFDAVISTAADRVQVRSTVSGRRAGGGGGSVAIVEFDAIARGATTVTVSDLVARDLSGRSIASIAPVPRVQMMVQ